MEEQMKGFTKFFILSILVAAVSLIGAVIGKNIVGYVVFGLGLAGTIAYLLVVFLKKSYFKEDRWKYFAIGLVLSTLLASSVMLFISSNSKTSAASARSSSTSSLSSLFGGTGARSSAQFSGGFSGGNATGRTYSGSGTFGTGRTFNGTGTTGSNSTTRNFSGTGLTGTSGTSTNISNSYTIALAARKKTEGILGWVFLGVGLACLAAVIVLTVMKKLNFAGDRRKVLIYGLVLGVLLGISVTLLVSKPSFSMRGGTFPTPTAAMPAQGTAGAPALPNSTPAVTSTPAITETPTPIPATATAVTPQATATATTEVVSSLVVCLSADYRAGLDVRAYPSNTARNVGSIPTAACFTIDGRNSDFPDWYHLAPGQSGFGGIYIGIDESKYQAWIYGKHLDKPLTDFSTLPELAVTGTAQ